MRSSNIDLYYWYSWAEPLKNETGISVKNAFEKIFKESNRRPEQLWVDKGLEFYNSHVKTLFERVYSTQNSGKAVGAERLNNLQYKDIKKGWNYYLQ